MIYRAVDKTLVVTADSGIEIWRGQPEGYPVTWAAPIPGSDDGVVLYEYYRPEKSSGSFHNLVRVRPFGTIVWRAQLPATPDVYTSAEILQNAISVFSFSCHRVLIDFETGHITDRIFTK